MELKCLPQTPGFGRLEWLLSFDRRSADFYGPPNEHLWRPRIEPFAADYVCHIIALAPVTADDAPEEFAAVVQLHNLDFAALSVDYNAPRVFSWTVAPSFGLALRLGFDEDETAAVMDSLINHPLPPRTVSAHPAGRHRLRSVA